MIKKIDNTDLIFLISITLFLIGSSLIIFDFITQNTIKLISALTFIIGIILLTLTYIFRNHLKGFL